MTEEQWLTSADPAAMIRFLQTEHVHAAGVGTVAIRREHMLASDSRLRLWVEACRAIVDRLDIQRGCAATVWRSLNDSVELLSCIETWSRNDYWTRYLQLPERANLLRHIVGNPFRPALTQPCDRCHGRGRLLMPVLHRGPGPEPDIRHVIAPPEGDIACFQCNGKGWLPLDPPDPWPAVLRELAEACVAKCKACHGSGRLDADHRADTIECRACDPWGSGRTGEPPYFALGDALLDAGMPELAAHFQETEHPTGCWVLDLILGVH